MMQPVAKIILPIPVDEPFTYRIPDELADLLRPGVQVIVPVGERYSAGIVSEISDASAEDLQRELREVADVVDPEPFIGADLLKLTRWIADYYISYLGEALRLINPKVNLEKSGFEVRRVQPEPSATLTSLQERFYSGLPEADWISIKKLEKNLEHANLLHCAHRLRRMELVETRYIPPETRKIYKTIDVFQLCPEHTWSEAARRKYGNEKSRARRARELIAFMETGSPFERAALRDAKFSSTLIRQLTEAGVLLKTAREIYRDQHPHFHEALKKATLTDEQQEFVTLAAPFIESEARFKTFLLHGITGSGKTRIYIELIRRVLDKNHQAIVLIPEIVLTPQIMSRFRNHFGEQVGVIHSRISAGERLEVLQKCREGKISVVIGPRSAIFAPFKKLGMIVVDEEHEGSYKSSEASPRYNARDVALYRAFLNDIPIVLGSATPSIESMYNAKNGKYEYFHLAKRISHRKLPRTQLVDNREQWRKGGELPLFSENLLLKLEARIICKEQAMILQNRRGYAPYLLCEECGYIEKCPNCDITLTYHLSGRNLRCHYCGFHQPAPDLCPQCRGLAIQYQGVGTQKIEEELHKVFPYARMLRMDQDTTRRKHDHAKMLEQFREHKADFLIGTKMIAKGLDFEKVTLVGVVNADHGLHFPDFRAAEKTFQLLVQASGRSGRGAHSGEVVIQTFDPDHYIYKFLLTHDYLKFYERELTSRKTLGYPPYSRLCLVRLVGEEESAVFQYAREIAAYLWKCNGDRLFKVLGPTTSPLARINRQYRYQILIKQPRDKDPSMRYVRKVLKQGIYLNPELKKWPVKIQIDIDPLDIL